MIEREEYCVDILQQTAALRAAVDAVSILVLEDHVQGCVRTAAERGEADKYVDEVDRRRPPDARPAGRAGRSAETSAAVARRRGRGYPPIHAAGARIRGQPLDAAAAPTSTVRIRTGADAQGNAVREGHRGDPAANRTGSAEDRTSADGASTSRRRERRPRTDRHTTPQEALVDRPREPLPTRVRTLPDRSAAAYDDALDAGLDGARPDADRRGRARAPSTATSGCCSPGPRRST